MSSACNKMRSCRNLGMSVFLSQCKFVIRFFKRPEEQNSRLRGNTEEPRGSPPWLLTKHRRSEAGEFWVSVVVLGGDKGCWMGEDDRRCVPTNWQLIAIGKKYLLQQGYGQLDFRVKFTSRRGDKYVESRCRAVVIRCD